MSLDPSTPMKVPTFAVGVAGLGGSWRTEGTQHSILEYWRSERVVSPNRSCSSGIAGGLCACGVRGAGDQDVLLGVARTTRAYQGRTVPGTGSRGRSLWLEVFQCLAKSPFTLKTHLHVWPKSPFSQLGCPLISQHTRVDASC